MSNELIGQGIASGAIAANRFVIMDESANGVIIQASSSTSTETIGISTHAAADGEKVFYYKPGSVAKLEAGGAINPGDTVMTDANGKGVAATATNIKLARFDAPLVGSTPSRSAAADGDLIDVLLLSDLTNVHA